MLKKRFLICLALLVALLVANLVMIQAASSSDLTFTLNADGNGYVVTKCSTTASGTLSIPATYSGKPVVEIGREAFLNCTKLTSVTIPSSVKTIGWYAFSGCTGLTSISIPDSVTTIDWFAFSGCTSLTNVTIGNGVTCIDASAFAGCTKLTTVTLGESVTNIGWSTFKGCTSLNSITIPESVTSIDRYAFYNCSSLSSVTFGGTQEEWNAITKGEANTDLTGAALTFTCEHSASDAVVENEIAATCDNAGSYDSVVNCSKCGTELSREHIVIAATDHKMVVTEPAIDATCEAAGKGAVLTCANGCGLTTGGDEIPARDHTDDDKNNVCDICGTSLILTDANLKFYYDYAQLQVGEDIMGYFIVNTKNFNYDEYYAEFKMGDQINRVPVGKTSGNYIYFYYTVYAFKMTEEISVTVYGVKDGVAYAGQSLTYTIRDSIVKKLDSWVKNFETNKNGINLLVNLLNYGTEAQKELNKENTNYPTDNLAPELLALIKTEAPEMGTAPTGDDAGKQATLYSMGMMLQERIKLTGMFKVTNAGSTQNSDYLVVIEMVESSGEVRRYEFTGDDLSFSGTKTKYVTFKFDGIKCWEMRCDMRFTLYLNGEQISATIVRSADMMANNLMAKYPTLIPAIMNYSDWAQIYFNR